MKFILLSLIFQLTACSSSKKTNDFHLYSCIYYNGLTSFILDKDLQNYKLYTNLNGSYYVYKEERKFLIRNASEIKCKPENLEGLEKFIK